MRLFCFVVVFSSLLFGLWGVWWFAVQAGFSQEKLVTEEQWHLEHCCWMVIIYDVRLCNFVVVVVFSSLLFCLLGVWWLTVWFSFPRKNWLLKSNNSKNSITGWFWCGCRFWQYWKVSPLLMLLCETRFYHITFLLLLLLLCLSLCFKSSFWITSGLSKQNLPTSLFTMKKKRRENGCNPHPQSVGCRHKASCDWKSPI